MSGCKNNVIITPEIINPKFCSAVLDDFLTFSKAAIRKANPK
jgi:hypothetical protein